jgi:integrase
MAKLIVDSNRPIKPFIIRWWEPDQKQRSFATRFEAERFMREAERFERGDVSETFGSYATRWNMQTGRDKRARTVRGYESLLRIHILPVFGDIPLNKITNTMCKDFLYQERTQARMVTMLFGKILKDAKLEGKIAKHPMDGIPIRRVVKRAEIVPVTYEQLETIEGGLRPSWRLAIWLMFGCGLRLGEALAVRADSVRENGVVLRVEEQVMTHRGKSDPKRDSLKMRDPGQFRDIPLASWLAEKIEAHCAEFGTDGFLFPEFAECTKAANTFTYRFRNGCIKAGVPELHPHILRHYFASTMLANRVPISDVSRWLGHKNIQITFDTYSHMMPSAVGEARDVSDKAFEQFKEAA